MVVALLEFWGIVVCWMLAFGVLSWLYMRIADPFREPYRYVPPPVPPRPAMPPALPQPPRRPAQPYWGDLR
jgi:hypothetical protein